MLDVVGVELELAERVKASDGNVLVEDTTRCAETKGKIDLEDAFLRAIGVTRMPVVVFEVDAVEGDSDCDRKPRIGPRICALEFASNAIVTVLKACTTSL